MVLFIVSPFTLLSPYIRFLYCSGSFLSLKTIPLLQYLCCLFSTIQTVPFNLFELSLKNKQTFKLFHKKRCWKWLWLHSRYRKGILILLSLPSPYPYSVPIFPWPYFQASVYYFSSMVKCHTHSSQIVGVIVIILLFSTRTRLCTLGIWETKLANQNEIISLHW